MLLTLTEKDNRSGQSCAGSGIQAVKEKDQYYFIEYYVLLINNP